MIHFKCILFLYFSQQPLISTFFIKQKKTTIKSFNPSTQKTVLHRILLSHFLFGFQIQLLINTFSVPSLHVCVRVCVLPSLTLFDFSLVLPSLLVSDMDHLILIDYRLICLHTIFAHGTRTFWSHVRHICIITSQSPSPSLFAGLHTPLSHTRSLAWFSHSSNRLFCFISVRCDSTKLKTSFRGKG